MSDLERLRAAVTAGPQGPTCAAIFDLDGTLIDGSAAAAFVREQVRRGQVPPSAMLESIGDPAAVERTPESVERLVRLSTEAEKGRSMAEFSRWSKRIFNQKLAGVEYPDARALVQAHREAGHTLVIASSATLPQVGPIAADLEIENVICTDMDVDANGVITGKLAGRVCRGREKASRAAAWSRDRGIKLADSWAYADGVEDEPLLATVGHPVALNPDRALSKAARDHHWETATLKPPPKAGPIDALRTLAGLGAFADGVFLGALYGLLKRSRRSGANLAGSIAPDLALRAAGVKLNIVGHENLWKARPAVFTFNHQSQLDVLVLSALLRTDFTAVAKKELASNPFFAPLGYMADIAYIDRGNNAKARKELAPTVEALRRGKSLAIAPEGTRSPTEKLGPFKKGAFNIAMQAGVPIVPIVMRNCGELMRPHSPLITPGTVDVVVLDPVGTTGWDHDSLDRHIAEVRQSYLDALAHWPTRVD